MYDKDRYKKNRQSYIDSVIKWQKKHPEKANSKQRRYNKKLKINALEVVGKTCTCCGVNEWWNLSIDHIIPFNGEKRVLSHAIYRKLINKEEDKTKYQTLCNGCNNSKNLGTKCQLEH